MFICDDVIPFFIQNSFNSSNSRRLRWMGSSSYKSISCELRLLVHWLSVGPNPAKKEGKLLKSMHPKFDGSRVCSALVEMVLWAGRCLHSGPKKTGLRSTWQGFHFSKGGVSVSLTCTTLSYAVCYMLNHRCAATIVFYNSLSEFFMWIHTIPCKAQKNVYEWKWIVALTSNLGLQKGMKSVSPARTIHIQRCCYIRLQIPII